jgi:hypothetical protein
MWSAQFIKAMRTTRWTMIALRRLLLLSTIAIVTAESGFSAPAANVSLANLLGQADAVVVATIQSTALSGPDAVLSLVINRVVKGSLTSGSSLPVTWSPSTSSGPIGVGTGAKGTGIWFLKQQGPAWIVLPVAIGPVPLDAIYINVPSGALPLAYAYDASLASVNRLSNEIAAAAQDPAAATALARIASSGATDDLGSNVLLPMWTQLSLSPTPITRAIGLAGQIRLGLPTALAALSNTDPRTFTSDAQDHLSAAICRYTNGDSGAVSSLGALTKSAYADNLKFCAVHALRAIHNKEALAYLSPLLDSASARLQYEAVAGIASFANGLPIQTPANTANMSLYTVPPNAPFATADTQKHFPTQRAFTKQPQTYISFWKSWLVMHAVN